MRFRSVLFCVLCFVFMIFTTACTKSPADDTEVTVPTTTPTTSVVVEVELDKMLDAATISDAIGEEMGEPSVSGRGTILTSIGVDSKVVLSVVVSERPIDVFYMMLQGYADIQPCPNLGETAWFSAVYNQLLVYGKGYMITVELTGLDDNDQNIQKLRCRQIAALLLEKM